MRGRVFQRSNGRGKPWSFVVDLPLDPGGVRGRGLLLVDTLSREWGVTVIHDDGKTVWFRLSPIAD